jgi:tRNA(Ile)-lysidine synthase
MPPPPTLSDAISAVPAGAWAVAVSGGADSVALLCLLRARQVERADLGLHVVHLDHQTRGPDSTADAVFVADLAAAESIPCTLQLRSAVEAGMTSLPANTSARYRAVRLELFRQVIQQHNLAGVLLAHHADDQAETIFLRLLRGSGPAGLAGMCSRTRIHGVTLLRPLLAVSRETLRSSLLQRGQPWREDASNQSPTYLRNRVRRLLADEPSLRERLLEMGQTFAALRDWVHRSAPVLGPAFDVRTLCDLPDIVAREAARRWLTDRGVPPEELTPKALERLLLLARDAASPPQCHFPGALLVRRRRGVVFVNEPRE